MALKDPKYTENLLDPENPEGRGKLKKAMIAGLIAAVYFMTVILLNAFGVISALAENILLVPPVVVALVYYLSKSGKDILN